MKEEEEEQKYIFFFLKTMSLTNAHDNNKYEKGLLLY